MRLVCPTCANDFAIEDTAVPTQGASIPCPKCGNAVRATWPVIDLEVEPVEADDRSVAASMVLELDSPRPAPPAAKQAAPAPAADPRGGDGTPRTAVVGPRAAASRSIELSDAGLPARKAGVPPATEMRPPGEAREAPRPKPVVQPSLSAGSAAPRVGEARFIIVVAATALLAGGLAALRWSCSSGDIAPPLAPNPLVEQVAAWRRAGLAASAPTLAACLAAADKGLEAGTDQGLRAARQAARSALLLDPDAPEAIAAYARVQSRWPDRLEPDELDDVLGAITSAVGRQPQGPQVAALEEARAWLLTRSGRLEAARQAAERALQLRPDAPSANLTRAVVRLHTRPEEAQSELVALRRTATGAALPLVTLYLGEAQARAGQLQAAQDTWQAALSGGPQDGPLLRRLARLAAELGDDATALSRLDVLLENDWASVEDRLLTARLLVRVKHKSADAKDVLDAGLAASQLSALDRARLLAEQVAVLVAGRPGAPDQEQASGWLDEALSLAPDLPELLYLAGLVDSRLEPARAIESFEAAAELAPDRPEIALRLALLLAADNESEQAEQAIASGLRESPHYVPLHLLRAALALKAGDRPAAAASARRALDTDPERHGEENRLAVWIDPGEAHEKIAKLLITHSRGIDNAALTTAAALAYHFAGDARGAEAALARAIRTDPNEVTAHLARGILAFGRGKRAVARRELDAAQQGDSQHAVVRLYEARLLEQLKDAAKAELLYRGLLEKNPLDAGARNGLARTLLARGARNEARSEALKVLSGRPDDGEALRVLAQLDGKRVDKRTDKRR